MVAPTKAHMLTVSQTRKVPTSAYARVARRERLQLPVMVCGHGGQSPLPRLRLSAALRR